jgi:hypothetical protein
MLFSAGATAPSFPTTASADRVSVQLSDPVTGETSTLTYDGLPSESAQLL